MISAWVESTVVNVFPTSSVEYKGVHYYPADVIHEVLGPFESLQLFPRDIAITGTRIVTSNPVAVSVGNTCTDVPYHIDACDHISEQLVPVDKWGKSFILNPFQGRSSGYLFQIVAARNDTLVSLGNGTTINLNEAQFSTIDMNSQKMTRVTADNPVLVMQYVKGTNADFIDSDPAMNRVIPNDQFVRRVTFPVLRLNSNVMENSYLAITTDCENFDSLPATKNNLPIQVIH